jgi:heme-degrading monooxygenase HmoA
MILRRWSGRIRTTDRDAYADYVRETGAGDYARTPGHLGFQMLFRDLKDGTSEVTTLSWWQSLESVLAFAGSDVTIARYYPEDDRFLLERPERVEHHEVVANTLPLV